MLNVVERDFMISIFCRFLTKLSYIGKMIFQGGGEQNYIQIGDKIVKNLNLNTKDKQRISNQRSVWYMAF